MGIGHKILHAWKWTFSMSFLGMGVSILVSIANYRILSPRDYGVNAVVVAIMSIFFMIQDLSLENALEQKKEVAEKDLSAVFWFLILFSTFLTFVAFGISFGVATYYQEEIYKELILLSAVLFFCNSINVIPRAREKRKLQFKLISIVNTTVQVGTGLMTMVFALNDFGLRSLIYGNLSAHLIGTTLYLYFGKLGVKFSFSIRSVKELLKFSRSISATKVVAQGRISAIPLILGKIFDVDTLGIFHFANSFCKLIFAQTDAMISQVLLPSFSKLQDRIDELRKLFLQMVEVTLLLSLALLVGFYLVGDDLISIVYGKKWISTVEPIRYLAILSLFENLFNKCTSMFMSVGEPNKVFKWQLAFSPSLLLFFSFSVFYEFDFINLIISYVIFSLLFFSWMYLDSIRKLEIRFISLAESVKVSFLTTFTMSVGVYLFDKGIQVEDKRIQLFFEISFGVIIFFLTLVFLKRDFIKVNYEKN